MSVELGPEPEVYEIRVNVSDEQPPKIEVLGRDNARIHEHSLPAEARGQILTTALNEGFFFPSEFKPDEKERPYFLEPALPPVTDLGFLSGAAEIRRLFEPYGGSLHFYFREGIFQGTLAIGSTSDAITGARVCRVRKGFCV